MLTDTALDRPMILFQDIVEILHRSMSTVHLQNTGGFELNDGWRISSVLVGIDYPRRGMVLLARSRFDCSLPSLNFTFFAFTRNPTV